MGFSMPELSERVIKELPAQASGNKVHWFTGAVLQGTPAPAGFGICVTANGAKSFILNYHYQGAYRQFTIGRWPTWTALLGRQGGA
jgi:Arm DNA-binding domain